MIYLLLLVLVLLSGVVGALVTYSYLTAFWPIHGPLTHDHTLEHHARAEDD